MTNKLPETGYLRIWQIIGDKKANPPIPPLIPVSAATLWNKVRSKEYPQPVKLGPRITAWRVSDIKKMIEERQ